MDKALRRRLDSLQKHAFYEALVIVCKRVARQLKTRDATREKKDLATLGWSSRRYAYSRDGIVSFGVSISDLDRLDVVIRRIRPVSERIG